MREFVIGDIHGGYRALKQVLDRVNFDYENKTTFRLNGFIKLYVFFTNH